MLESRIDPLQRKFPTVGGKPFKRGGTGETGGELIWSVWFIWSVSCVWSNQTKRINQIDQMDRIDQTDTRTSGLWRCLLGGGSYRELKCDYEGGVSRLGVRGFSEAPASGTLPKMEYRYRATNQYSR